MSEIQVRAQAHAKSALDAARRRGYFWPKELHFFNRKVDESQSTIKEIGTTPSEIVALQRHMPAPSPMPSDLLDILPW